MFAELNWMTFPERVNYQKAILVFKIVHGLTPSYLHKLFQPTSEIHNRSLRSTVDTQVKFGNLQKYANLFWIQDMQCHS